MMNFPNVLLVGGTGRNVGKTEFVCNCIKHFSKLNEIIGLKITNHFHEEKAKPYKVSEEFNKTSDKDSSRMLRAGASRVFYVQTDSEHLSVSFTTFLNQVPKDSIIICESNALREIIQPSLYFIVKSAFETDIKLSAKTFLKLADKIIISDGNKFDMNINRIKYKNKKWEIII